MSEEAEVEDQLPEDADITQVRDALKRERQRRVELQRGLPDANALAMENAMLRAGVPMDTPLGAMFTRAYEGERDPEAIKVEWGKIAPQPRGEEPPPPEPTEPRTPQPGEAVLENTRSQPDLAAESTPPGEEPQKPLGHAMMDEAFRAQGGARTRPSSGMGRQATEAAFNVLFERVAKGDPAAVFKKPDESWTSARDRWEQNQ